MSFRDTSDNDILVGVSLYFMLIYCNIESLKLSIFHELLAGGKDVTTILQATKNNMELHSIKEAANKDNLNQFYGSLINLLDLELQQVLLAISTPSDIKALMTKNSIFLSEAVNSSDLGKLMTDVSTLTYFIQDHP